MNLAAFIAARRAQLGLSLAQAAEYGGLTPQGLHGLETGVSWNPKVTTLIAVARALRVKPDRVFLAALESIKDAKDDD